eukprot:359899-Hanusia_phi.AAC.2
MLPPPLFLFVLLSWYLHKLVCSNKGPQAGSQHCQCRQDFGDVEGPTSRDASGSSIASSPVMSIRVTLASARTSHSFSWERKSGAVEPTT